MAKTTRGLVIINTGNGKGKTTAALGMALRAWGNDMKVVVVQFVKRSDSNYGEHKAARRIGLEMVTEGAGFVFAEKDATPHKRLALEQWHVAQEKLSSGAYDLVVLDEITYPLQFGWIPVEEVVQVLKQRPPGLHVVITGRNAPQALIDFADTVAEIRDVKHHFRQGIKAQPGVEM